MTRLMSILAGAGIIAGGAAIPVPALAQQSDLSEIVVYGTDPCPRSTDDQVVICARKPEGERYRIPEKLRSTGPRQSNEAWASRAKQLETVGATGINSCSPVGPGGFTGCLTQVIKQARQERRQDVTESTAPDE
ncbi:MAG: hypothetical protein ABIR63_06585 [Sphingomicrobium sp.]